MKLFTALAALTLIAAPVQLVQTLGVVAKFTAAGVQARTDAEGGFNLAKEAWSDFKGLGDAWSAIDS